MAQVNPTFISAFNNLKSAHANLASAKRSGGDTKKAEAAMHNAEAVWCNQNGVIDGGTMTDEAAKRAVDGYVTEVHSWYA